MGVIQKSGVWTTLINYTGAILGFVCVIILFPRLMSPEEVGLTLILKTAALLFSQFSYIGSGNIVLRFFPFFRTGEKQFNGIFTLTFLISLTGIIIVTLLYFLFQQEIIHYFTGDKTQGETMLFIKHSILVIPIFIFIVFYTLFSVWLRSLMKIIVAALYFEVILRLLFIVIVFIFSLDYISFDSFIKLYALCYAVPAVGLFIYCWRYGLLSFSLRITQKMKEYFKPAIKYGLLCFVAGIGASLVGTIDSLMLGGMVGLAGVAVYTISTNLISALQMPFRAFSSIASPLVAEYWQKNDMKGMKTIYQKFTLNIVIVSLLIFLLTWLNLNSLYLIMPEIYSTGKWAFLILFTGKFINMSTGLNSVILSTSKKYVWDLYFAIFLIVAAIISNRLLIPLWSINGAALATTICITVISVSKVIVVKQLFHLQPFTNKVWLVVFLGIIVCILITFIPVFLHWTLEVVMRSCLVLVLFLLPIYLFKISDELNSGINKILKKVFPSLNIQ